MQCIKGDSMAEPRKCLDCKRGVCRADRFLCDSCWDAYQMVLKFEQAILERELTHEDRKAS